MKKQVRGAYSYDRDAASAAVTLRCEDPSRAVQSERESADINILVRRFGITGRMPVNPKLPSYIQYEDVFDYRSAVEAVMAAEEAFMSLPAIVRSRFNHDPQAFLEFTAKPENLPELRNMGLAKAVPGASPEGDVKPPQAGSGGHPQ